MALATPLNQSDKPLTERLDYFSAGLTILFGLYAAVIRLFHLYPSESLQQGRRGSTTIRSILRHLWTSLCIVLYLAHITYLSLAERFDYGFNIIANLVVGLLHNLLWLLFGIAATPLKRFPFADSASRHQKLQSPSETPRRWVKKPLVCVALMTAATLLEVFDFPPWYRVIDAHSLWHLATVPIASLWYDMLVEDSRDEGWVWHRLQ